MPFSLDADKERVKAKYKQLAFKWHPEKHSNSPESVKVIHLYFILLPHLSLSLILLLYTVHIFFLRVFGCAYIGRPSLTKVKDTGD